MAIIKVICGGCGIQYTDANGNARHALKTPESGPFECDDAQAARLIGLGVAAAYVDGIGWQQVGQQASYPEAATADNEPEATAEADETTEQAPEPKQTTGHLDAADLESWDYNDLKKLAADMGVTPSGKKKADYIAAITEADVIVDDDGDDVPELGVADPE